jgi:hypothetical protein
MLTYSTNFHIGSYIAVYVSPKGVSSPVEWLLNPLFSIIYMIVFNTKAKAKHYIKYKQALIEKSTSYYDSESFQYYYINNKRVLVVSGWQCGCGCGNGSRSAKVIGRIKSISEKNAQTETN